MNNVARNTLVVCSLVVNYGCASGQQLPLIFGQTHTLGISVSGGAAEGGADFTLGYRDKNIAIVPVALEIKEGEYAQNGSSSGQGFDDAFSVIGQFEARTGPGGRDVGLGKFFATGSAAKALADGFASKLGNAQPDEDGLEPPEAAAEEVDEIAGAEEATEETSDESAEEIEIEPTN